MSLRWLTFPALLLAGLGVIGAALVGFVLLVAYPNLPSIESLTDYQPKVPLRVYTSDGALIGEFGEERRSVVRIQDVPDLVKNAIISAEDSRFYQHSGVDYVGVARAAYSNVISGGKREGASTITMQVARNFFLSSEKTLTRKLYEMLLAFRIERNLSKAQILELYINQIYLGQRAYGFASAAQIYFGKTLAQLTPAEAAMLAGLPKAPSSYNPVANPKRARERQIYVLDRMHELHYITDAQLKDAVAQHLLVRQSPNDFDVHAEYVAEMVRQMLYDRYPDDVYTKGFRVYTTLTKADQDAAYTAVRRGVMDYDRRHGYRGPEGYEEISGDTDEAYDDALSEYADADDLYPALVLDASPKAVKVYHRGETLTISGDGLKFAASALDAKAQPNKAIRRGAVVRITQETGKDGKLGPWQIVELPQVQAAFISVNSQDGAVRSMVGGFDFDRNKYNHVTQGWRQPGSGFKPFIYSAALEKGFTPATVVNDAPVVVDPFLTGGQVWQPRNDDDKYDGPIRLRTALAKSKNMVSIRVLQAIGPQYAQDYITRFGFDADKHPPYLTMALGAGSVTMWQMARAYSVFANGGYKLEPYIVSKIVDDHGNVLAQAQPSKVGDESLRVIDPRNAFIMDSLLHEVTRSGTAARASSLGRGDLAGKTGTTNDFVDAWFNGYQDNGVVGIAWLGYDQPRKLGNAEFGAVGALGMWMSYMGTVLKGVPEVPMTMPDGVVTAHVNDAGQQIADGGHLEYFYRETPPPMAAAAPTDAAVQASDAAKSQLF